MAVASLKERVVLITGGSRGIGEASARGFLADGAIVIGFSRSAAGLDWPEAASGRYLALTGDIACRADVERAVGEVLDRFGRIDVLVNNAGALAYGSFLEIPFDEWEAAFAINVIGPAYITRLVLPGMLERGHGRIINIVSRSAENPHPKLTAYASSKSALVTFTRSLAEDIDPEAYPDVQVNGLIPGVTRTAMMQEMGWTGDLDAIPGPETVYPHIRALAITPPGGSTGGTFWMSKPYAMYKDFLNPLKVKGLEDIPHKPE